MIGPYKEFVEQADTAGEQIREAVARGQKFLVCYHFDADGIAAAGILSKTLYRNKASFQLRVLRQLDEQTIDFLSKSVAEILVFADIGSGYLELLRDMTKSKSIFILDHHQINGEGIDRLTHVNPHLSGIDGGKEISGAGVSYIVAKAVDQQNVDLSPLAVVGSVGDMQDKNEKRTLQGLNSPIVNDAVQAGLLKVETDLLIYGRETRPIHKALSHTMNPFLPGLSGEEDNCLALLSSLSIPIKVGDRWRTVVELTNDEKKRIFSAIIEHITSKGLAGAIAMNLIGSVYTLLQEEKSTPTRDAREYATLLNACGRMDRPSLGIAVCLGERGSTMTEATRVLSEHRKTLAKYMTLISERPETVEDLGRLCVIHGESFLNENMTGAVSSLLSSSETFAGDRIIIVSATTKNGNVKISARATEEMVGKGLNLGLVLQSLSKKHGGIGGGHKIAAGAEVPDSKLKEFLADLKEAVEGGSPEC